MLRHQPQAREETGARRTIFCREAKRAAALLPGEMEALGLVLRQTKRLTVAGALVAHRRLRATLATVELVDFTVAAAAAAVLHLLILATLAQAATAHPASWL